MKKFLFYLIQWTWALPQNIAGAVLLLILGRNVTHFGFGGALVTLADEHPLLRDRGSVSLGMFVFLNVAPSTESGRMVLIHEYGHTIQSLFLGPLFFPVIGIPSVIWAELYSKRKSVYKLKGLGYTSRFPENSASQLGERVTGDRAMNW